MNRLTILAAVLALGIGGSAVAQRTIVERHTRPDGTIVSTSRPAHGGWDRRDDRGGYRHGYDDNRGGRVIRTRNGNRSCVSREVRGQIYRKCWERPERW